MAAIVRNLEHIGMTIAEGVIDLVDDSLDGIIRVLNKIQADRVEGEAQDTRHGHQEDAVAGGVKAPVAEHGGHALLQRRGGVGLVGAVVAIMDTEQVEAIVREASQISQIVVDMVEIEKHLKDRVFQAMRLGRKTPVHDLAGINTRFNASRRHGVSIPPRRPGVQPTG